MNVPSFTGARSKPTPLVWHVAGFLFVFLIAVSLRRVLPHPDQVFQGYLQVTTGLLAFVFTAVTLVRFQGTQDRISLILGVGFLLSGTVVSISSILFFQLDHRPVVLWAPVAWWISRMLLALLLVVALLVDKVLPRSRHPKCEIAGALLTVVGFTYLITAALRHLPAQTAVDRAAYVPSPQQLLPGVFFLIAMLLYRRRLDLADGAFDRTIYASAWLNLAAQIAASQSQQLLDAPFVLAEGLTVASYAIALGGALLDTARLFEQVRHMAVSDALTGLANYRRLLDVLESETERTNRTGRPFAVLLLDLDGLKTINDTYGHLVGSRSICRVADILRIHCRAIDVAARYGGDEFALVLPETQDAEAQRVANRIHEVMLNDTEQPKLSASIGISIYRGDGERIERLLSEADQNLYVEKARRAKRANLPLHSRRRGSKA